MSAQKSTVFVGSSAEQLDVLNAVVQLLSGTSVEVVPWTDSKRFRKIGDYFLDSLIAASAAFDFAILVFGPDDVVESREKIQKAPRDNVIFELGLFLSRLDRRRTWVIAPKTWKVGLKILTDLYGLNFGEYDPLEELKPGATPTEVKKWQRKLKAHLKKDVCDEIARNISRIGPRTTMRGPKGIINVFEPLDELIRNAQAMNTPVHIRNIALDMEVTWPMVRDELLSREYVRDITWQSLMIDYTSTGIRNLSSDTVSLGTAEEQEKEIREFCATMAADLAGRGMCFECRAYNKVPTIHGFLFNDNVGFLSLYSLRGGKLFGSPNPYIRLESPIHPAADEAAVHFLLAFASWFEFHWEKGRKIWPN